MFNAATSNACFREKRREIARLRRRLDRRATRLTDRTLLLTSWRNYVEKYPARSLAGAAGAGMTLAMLLGNLKKTGKLGKQIYDAAVGGAWGEVLRDLMALAETSNESSTEVEDG